MTTTPAIQIAGLTKSYGDHSVLRGVDFDLARGSIFALLGSNGAGKTTTIKILATLIKADEGTATVDGFDVAPTARAARLVRVDQTRPHRPRTAMSGTVTRSGAHPAQGRVSAEVTNGNGTETGSAGEAES